MPSTKRKIGPNGNTDGNLGGSNDRDEVGLPARIESYLDRLQPFQLVIPGVKATCEFRLFFAATVAVTIRGAQLRESVARARQRVTDLLVRRLPIQPDAVPICAGGLHSALRMSQIIKQIAKSVPRIPYPDIMTPSRLSESHRCFP